MDADSELHQICILSIGQQGATVFDGINIKLPYFSLRFML